MRLFHILAATALGFTSAGASGQVITEAEAERMMAELQADHIAANVPDEADFSAVLERDLRAYFAAAGFRRPSIRFEMLRHAPTQSGIAYPKYYLWVWVWSEGRPAVSGAVRVAAVQRERFEVTDFRSREAIIAQPGQIGSVFPAPLVEPIRARATAEAFPAHQ
jgi:hypothetical protein